VIHSKKRPPLRRQCIIGAEVRPFMSACGANPQREKAFVPAVMWGGADSFEQSVDGVG
jgi:hypothetical protein